MFKFDNLKVNSWNDRMTTNVLSSRPRIKWDGEQVKKQDGMSTTTVTNETPTVCGLAANLLQNIIIHLIHYA